MTKKKTKKQQTNTHPPSKKLKLKSTTPTYIKASRVWRYQRGNQNPYIEEKQTPQWPKEKGQKDKHPSIPSHRHMLQHIHIDAF